MKVVLFCGGLGTRLRDYSDSVPKPMVEIGYRPILWHVMKYYAHFGHKEFILVSRLQGRLRQELLHQLQRGPLQRLRPHRAAAPSCAC